MLFLHVLQFVFFLTLLCIILSLLLELDYTQSITFYFNLKEFHKPRRAMNAKGNLNGKGKTKFFMKLNSILIILVSCNGASMDQVCRRDYVCSLKMPWKGLFIFYLMDKRNSTVQLNLIISPFLLTQTMNTYLDYLGWCKSCVNALMKILSRYVDLWFYVWKNMLTM